MARFLAASLLIGTTTFAHADTRGLPAGPPALGDDTAEVVGGTAVPAGKWPDAVAVLGDQGACTGTLIAPDVVLTAGHCAQGMTRVIANTTNYDQAGGTQSAIQSITAYPNWEGTYDVAVIVLTTPITTVTPRKLGTACTFQTFAQKPMVHLVGFGATDVQGQTPNTQLNEVTTGVTDPDCTGGNGCQTAVAPGGEFVAGGNNRDSCFGDSGGPVYLETPRGPVVVGVVSRGVDNATNPCGGGGIYVRTDKIVAWLEQTSGKSVEKDLCEAQPPMDPSGSGSGSDPAPTGPEGGGEGGGDGYAPDVTGGCSTGGGTAGALAIAAVVALAARRRRRADARDATAQAAPPA